MDVYEADCLHHKLLTDDWAVPTYSTPRGTWSIAEFVDEEANENNNGNDDQYHSDQQSNVQTIHTSWSCKRRGQ